tara:strand:- start:453 stop:1145 length:693 start_codon:yes stop_codon:yes gene_type:complete
MNHPAHISAQTIGNYGSYIDTGVTLKQSATESTGAIEVAGNNADNDEGSIISGGGAGGMVKIDASGAQRIAFECRFKKADVDDNGLSFFVGLSEEGSQVTTALAEDSGVLNDKDFIGFHVLADDGDSLDFTWRKSGAAVQVHADIATMAADTYMKMGFLYDPVSHPNDKKIKIFIDNGVEESVYVTQTQLDAATFPDDEELCLFMATKMVSTTTTARLAQMDWWALGVED